MYKRQHGKVATRIDRHAYRRWEEFVFHDPGIVFAGRRHDCDRTVEFVERGFATEVYQGGYQVRRVERKETIVLGEYRIGYTGVRGHKGIREVHQRKEDDKAVGPDRDRRVPRRIGFHKRVEATD